MVRVRLLVVLALLSSLVGLVPSAASDTPDPTHVVIAGSLQDELGCPGDWQADCTATGLSFDSEDAVWQQLFSLPAGAFEYKAALNLSWDENYGAGAVRDGANIGLNLGAPTDVKFYYDHETHWITDNQNSVIATVPGSYQTALGCSGDWDPGCLRSWLQDPDGDGIAEFTSSAIPAGSYEAKVAINESWDENYGDGGVPNGPNIAFTVPDAATTTFSYDTASHILTITSTSMYDSAAVAGSLQDELGCPGDWQPECAATELSRNSDDGVYRQMFNVPAGNWEYKAALNDTWDENYGANAVPGGANIPLNLGAATDVTFYYSPVTHWITDNVNSRIVTAAGGFQSELGCPGDWSPNCLLSWLQDIDGDGIYTFSTDAIPAGDYEVKAALNESWDENYGEGGVPGGANIPFTSYGRNVTFSFDSATNVLTVEAEGLPGIDNNVHWDELGHDSRNGMYRSPSGAVPTGTDVTLRFRAMSGDLEFATVRLWNDRLDVQSFLPMTKVLDDGTYEWWETTLATGDLPTVYWYRFVAQDGEAIAYYEDDDARLGGWGQTYGDSPDNSWQLTVFDPAFETPDWVKNAVVYQIFPDRFRDGDESNNTEPGGFFYEERTTEFRSGGIDWLTPICEPRATGDISSGDYLLECANLYSQNFYGGDLQGITDELGYLEDLGVTALYLNPIFESPSNHRYDTTDYLQIEDSLGDLDTFLELVDEAHKRGINVILDGVFNHTSSDSIYFDRYSRYDSVGACESETSPYRDWYYFEEGGGPCAGDTNYTSWFGFDSLPKLNSTNPQVQDLIHAGGPDAVARYWMQYADGWRLDVAGDVDQGVTGSPDNPYWEEFRAAVHATNPDAYIVGEEWGNASSWVLGDEWDATMNYQFSSAVLGFWRDTPFTDNDHNASSSAGIIEPLVPTQLWEELSNLAERYPEEAYLAMMNLLGSHDTNRALFMLDHNAATGTDDTLLDDPNYDWSDALDRLRGVAILQMTLPGAPTIYYGDEVGLVGPTTYVDGRWEDDPYNRVPYPWLEDGLGTPYYTHLQSATAQQSLFDHYAALTAARDEHPALRTGSMDLLYADDATGVLAYGRWIDEKRGEPAGSHSVADKADAAIVVVNRGDGDATVTLDLAEYLGAKTKVEDVLSGAGLRVGDDGSLVVTVPAGSGVVLVPTQQIASRPDTPEGLMVTAERSGEIDLSWDPVGDRIEYDVYRTLLSGGGYELVGMTSGTTFTDSGLTNAIAVHYVVVARDTKTLLQSGMSNEAFGIPHHDLTAGWFDLVWPFSITHTISTVNPTETVYGQVWLDGYTGPEGPAEGVTAQVGFGVTGSDPAGWTWTDMEYIGPGGFAPNNDEHAGSMAPDALGLYDYTVRWSSDDGRSWLLSPTLGSMEVKASGDTEAPSTPMNLAVTGVTAASVSLSWDASTDNVAVAGYEMFRDGIEIAEVTGTEFTDTGVVTGETYTYVVRAFDTSWNRSGDSDAVPATPTAVVIDVTFLVTVPDYSTGAIYVGGSFPSPLPFWDPGGIDLEPTGNPDEWSVTLSMLEGTEVEYKYTRGSWDSVEKDADCNEIANRSMLAVDEGGHTMTITDTVEKWRDLDFCP